MFDFFCKSRADEASLDEGTVLDDALLLHLKEVQLLDKVCIVLVELSIPVDICKNPQSSRSLMASSRMA